MRSTCAVVLRMRNMAVDIPLTTIYLASTFVAALLTLLSSQSLSRLSDCRSAFGKAILYTRDMAQVIVIRVPQRQANCHDYESVYLFLSLLLSVVYVILARIFCLVLKCQVRHLALFVWLLKKRLRDTKAKGIVRTMLANTYSQDADFIVQHRKTPVTVLSKLCLCITHMVDLCYVGRTFGIGTSSS